MRTTRKFPPFPPAELDYTETTDWSFQTPHQEIQKTSKRKYAASSIHNGLRITIEANEKTIDFLEVTFNLNKSTYQPFTKPPPREKQHPRHQRKTVIPFIRQSILRPSHPSISKSTRQMRIPVYFTLRTTYN